MCGRFTLTTPGDVLAEAFGLDETPDVEARYNIAPTQPIAAVGRRDRASPRRLSMLRWGLLPPGPAPKAPLINARAETLWERPAFRRAAARRRCLVPADGFYEWQKLDGRKQAMHIHARDARPFAFAGIWELPPAQGEPASCAIVTTAPNDLVRPIHDRMPVILSPDAWDTWLDPACDDAPTLSSLLLPCPAELLVADPVGPRVNDARFDGPECLGP